MDPISQKCPLCAEDIPLTAEVCPYCGAKFDVTSSGYCTACHEMMSVDVNGRCIRCGGALLDVHTESKLIQPQTTPVEQPSKTPPASHPALKAPPAKAPIRSRKKNTLWLRIFALLSILLAIYLLWPKANLPAIFSSGAPRSTHTPYPSYTPLPSYTPEPTSTPRPSPTPTPLPVEVTFESIGDVDTGELVILVGRLVLTKNIRCVNSVCGLLLENPADTAQKITIFILAGDEPNQLKPVPEKYSKGDIKVRMDDGSYALVGYRLRVTGRVCETTSGNPCLESIRKVELYQVK